MDAAPRNLTEELARFIASVRLDDIPGEVVGVVRLCIIDTLGVCLHAAASGGEMTKPVEALASVQGAGGDCTVIGRRSGYPAEAAALWNGVLAHCFDFDDTNFEGLLHPGAPIIPAVFAASELRDRSQLDFLRGVVVGYEIGARVGRALGDGTYDRGFHVTAIAGLMGATAGVCAALGLDAQRTESALGLAGSQAAGSMQYLESGAENKRLHPGLMARAAIDSAILAEAGLKGAGQAIEGRWGLLRGYSEEGDAASLVDELGSRWLAAATGVKPYPSCRFTHAAIDAAKVLRRRAPEGPVTVRISPRGYSLVGEPTERKLRPQTVVDAQFSVYFQVAAALLHGDVSPEAYEDLSSPDLLKRMSEITVISDPGLEGLSARVGSGEWDESRMTPSGDPPDGVNDDVVLPKFRQLATIALGADAAEEALAELSALGRGGGLRDLAALLVPR